MAGSNQNNSTRSNGAFDAFASQAANSAELLEYVKRITEQAEIIARNTALSRTSNSSSSNWRSNTQFFRDHYEQQFGSSRYSNRRANTGRYRDQDAYADGYSYARRSSSGFNQRAARTFEDGLLKGLSEGLLGFNWKTALSKGLNNFAANLGVKLEDIPGLLGEQLSKEAIKAFKQTALGKKLTSKINTFKNKLFDQLGPEFLKMFKSSQSQSGFNFFQNMGFKGGGGAATSSGGTALVKAGSTKLAGASAAKSGVPALIGKIGGAAGAGAAANPYVLAALVIIVAVLVKLKQLADAVSPAVEGVVGMFNTLKAVGNRYADERKKFAKLASERLAEDVKTLIETPFNILKESAESVEKAWDSTLTTITATQGYTKAQTQDLMAYVADRLRSEGLTSVISAASIIEKLPDVLREGLSGRVAEEFAYQASILNAAIPTQDFFQYAAAYSSIVANLVKDGQTQADAIDYATAQLKQFASNVLYASRSVAGGTSTGLKNAQSLFEQSVKIGQAGRTSDISQISSVMTSVAGIVGAIAPDLATSITDAVYNAAVGGNETTLVALRSLAGINASNTEFLRALVNEPKKLFEQLFRNLSSMQNMSNDAYMEVADQVSLVFGLTRDAFARIDFDYVADALHSADINNQALNENMKLLVSGQTTLTKDQLRNQQINKYMLEEGLALVLDSEVGRAIQQHMWDEQLAREITQAEYSVNIGGAALQLWEGIKLTIDLIQSVLSPFHFVRTLNDMVMSSTQAMVHESELQTAILATAIGGSTERTEELLDQLLKRNKDLNLVDNYVNLVKGPGSSVYADMQKVLDTFNQYAYVTGQIGLVYNWLKGLGENKTTSGEYSSYYSGQGFSGGSSSFSGGGRSFSKYHIASQYAYGTVSKSQSRQQLNYLLNAVAPETAAISSAVATSAMSVSATKMQQLIDRLDEDFSPTVAFEDWISSDKGIASWQEAISELGYEEQQLRELYGQYQSRAASEEQARLNAAEQEFWAAGTEFWTVRKEFTTEIDNILTPKFDQIALWKSDWGAWRTSWQTWKEEWVSWSDLTNRALGTSTQYSVLGLLSDISTQLHNWETDYWSETSSKGVLASINTTLSTWSEDYSNIWKDRWLQSYTNTMYGEKFGGIDYAALLNTEKDSTSTAIDRLANALVTSVGDLSDPTVQTNSILAQILLLLTQLVQQTSLPSNNQPSLGSTLIELALGRSK